MSDTREPPHADDYVPARMVNEFVYCPRLAYLEWVQGEWDDNLDTIHGRWVHRRVDNEPATAVPDPDEGSDHEAVRTLTARSILLSSDRLRAIDRRRFGGGTGIQSGGGRP